MTGERTYVWGELRDAVIAVCADAPHAQQEARILEVFTRHPQLVADGIAHVLASYHAGKVRAFWPVLVKHVEEAAKRNEAGKTTATDATERKTAIDGAQRWIKATGIHYDRESEVVEELFGWIDRVHDDATPWYEREPRRDTHGKVIRFGGMLTAYADTELTDQLLTLWASERPRGKAVEAEAEERAARYRATHAPKTKADDVADDDNPFDVDEPVSVGASAQDDNPFA